MDVKRENCCQQALAQVSSGDQLFLLNFIMTTYLGPDVYSDNPRRSVISRFAKSLPPYTSKNLGPSFLSISQLESLYYYVLRNADRSLVLQPHLLHMYLKGNPQFPSFGPVEECKLFTSLFPLHLHGRKRYSEGDEIVKGIILIDDPVTSHTAEEDLRRFRCLSGLQELKIEREKSLTYGHGYRYRDQQNQNDGAELETCSLIVNDRDFSGRSTNGKEIDIAEVHNSSHHIHDASVVSNSTEKGDVAGQQFGAVDIGVSKAAYFFQVALPGVRRDFCRFSCEIESDGKVHIEGYIPGGKTVKKRSRTFQMKSQQTSPAGPFALTFHLPGPVDPRLFSPDFRSDGIFEAVVLKQT